MWTLSFRLPGNILIAHKFNKSAPLSTLVQQLRYDMNYSGGLILILPPSMIIDCDLDTPIEQCRIHNMQTITVAKA
jgi:hypothetical protein